MKTIIFGIDGAAPELVNRWIISGELPNLKNISKKGFFAKLKSTMPPFTGPAWTSFATGKNPGKHGIGDFTKKQGNYERRVITSGDIKDERIWDILSRKGLSSIVINVPPTYPVKKMKGVQISCMLSPGKKKGWCYPENLIKKMEKNIGEYKILAEKAQSYNPGHEKEFYKDITETEEKRAKAVKYLINSLDWDFLMVVFNSTDFIQHFMWDTLNTEISVEGKPWRNAVKNAYKQVDRLIGEIVDKLEEKANVFIMSDHGFGPMEGMIYLNTWLFKNGYLKIRKSVFSQIKKYMFLMGWNAQSIWKFLDKVGLGWLPGMVGKNKRKEEALINKLFLSQKDVDWKNTQAYAYGLMGQIYINADEESREYQKIKAGLKKDISNIKNEKGEKIVTNIYEKNNIYKGEKKKMLADLIVEVKNMAINAYPGILGSTSILTQPPQHRSGTHRKDGIFLGFGPDIKNKKNNSRRNITDITPTILHLMGYKVPEDMDGHILKGIFRRNSDPYKRKVKYCKPKYRKKEAKNFEKEEEEAIKKRLRSLGYTE